MAATLEELEGRITALEREMRDLREQVTSPAGASVPTGAAQSWGAAWARLLQQAGIQGQPVGAENVQKMVAACGFKPEDNAFSKEILAMREE
jgi:hypothetical protein